MVIFSDNKNKIIEEKKITITLKICNLVGNHNN